MRACPAVLGITARVSLAALLVLVPDATAARDFSSRFSENTQGDITLIGNTLMTCVPTAANCAAARQNTASSKDNNNYPMTRVDVDGDAKTIDSSSAFLTLDDNAVVLFAGLYYGGRLQAGTGGQAGTEAVRDKVKLAVDEATCQAGRKPAYGEYQAAVDDVKATKNGVKNVVRQYSGFVDVTSVVRAAGDGCYTVADVQLGTGSDSDQGGGWGLVVAYELAGAPPRNLTVFDGMQFVATPGDQGVPVRIRLEGFQTPPAPGAVNTSLGFVAFEGDSGATGDTAKLNTSYSLPPVSNFFRSSISVPAERRIPDWPNMMGFDANVLAAPAGAIKNGDTTATIDLTTTSDGYAPVAVFFATELYAPQLITTKSVSPTSAAKAGDRLSYTMTIRNGGLDAATNTKLSDPLPSGTTFVPGSLRIDAARRPTPPGTTAPSTTPRSAASCSGSGPERTRTTAAGSPRPRRTRRPPSASTSPSTPGWRQARSSSTPGRSATSPRRSSRPAPPRRPRSRPPCSCPT